MKHLKSYNNFDKTNEGLIKNLILAGMLSLSSVQTRAAKEEMKEVISHIEKIKETSGKDIKQDLKNSGVNIEEKTIKGIKSETSIEDFFVDKKKYVTVSVKDDYKKAWTIISKCGKSVGSLFVIKLDDGTFVVCAEVI